MGLTGFSLCAPKALSSVLRYNTVILGVIPQRARRNTKWNKMSPDLEWKVDNGPEQQAIAKISSNPPGRGDRCLLG
jgi:hypothetical protein